MSELLCEIARRIKTFKKGLINIKNNNQKCFLWSRASYINLVKVHPERITWEDKKTS